VVPAAEAETASSPTPTQEVPAPPAPIEPAVPPAGARLIGVDKDRRLPSIERALSGPGSRGETSWRREVKVVTGSRGPGRPDQETLDRERARLPLAGPRRIAVLGCTRGAGQTVTTLMTGHILAAARGDRVAALDLNPGGTSLAARNAPAISLAALLAGREPAPRPDAGSGEGPGAGHGEGPGAGRGAGPGSPTRGRLDVIGDPPGAGRPRTGEVEHYQRLADLLAARYPLTMVDAAPLGLTRLLSVADQLILVAPASPDAATSLANTQQWLGAHGYAELAGRAVTVINGVSRRTMPDVLRAESVARGRCRAIVRVPWDDLLSARPATPSDLHPQTRLAYTALAGVLVAGLAAAARASVPGRNLSEHAD
jgi:MinD-like ATPase involved in chromosome partitioning or flagellar assembly